MDSELFANVFTQSVALYLNSELDVFRNLIVSYSERYFSHNCLSFGIFNFQLVFLNLQK